jgi:hypothetical protein
VASRFWVGGTGTWDSSTTTHWAASTGGAGGQSVPGSGDTVTFDGSSGGGTVTVNFGGLITIQSLTCGAFTGTLDFSANNNSITLTAAAGFSGSGSGARTINLGNGTWTLSAAGATWAMTTVTGLTFAANSSTIAFTGTLNNVLAFNGGGLTYNIVTFDSPSILASRRLVFTGSNTFASLVISPGNGVVLPNAATQTVTSLSITGSATLPNTLQSSAQGSQATISVASGSVSMPWIVFMQYMTFTGGATFTAPNSYDFSSNVGVTITQPLVNSGSRARAFTGM